ncbi:MAG: peptidase M11 [Vicinamibacterales bacterium]
MPAPVQRFPFRAAKALGLTLLVGALAFVPKSGVTVQAQNARPIALPPQAADRADEQFEGELEVHYEDSNTGARLVHQLRVGTERFDLAFEDNLPPGFEHGTRVRTHGRRVGNTLSLKSGNDVQAAAALSTSNTFGVQKTLVMLVNFQDNTSAPENWANVYNTTFQGVSDYYRENSYGQTSFAGDVVGYYTLPMSGSVCDYNTIASLAEQAASRDGVSVSSYPRRVFVFPRIASCGWWGLGNVGGSPSRAWVNGTYALFVAAHELGHNLGNYHSHSQPCDVAGCSVIEYGDDHDIMGNIAAVHTNAFQKERLGWLNYGASPPIQTVSTSGTFVIDPMATPGVYPKALKILKSGTTTGTRTFYYIEVRTAAGFDAGAAPGVLIHTGSESSGSTSYQLDLSPNTSAFDSILDVGQTFTDGTIGLTIATLSASDAGATVQVSVNGGSSSTCVTRTPTMSLSPSGQQTTNAGQTVNYDVTIVNNDDAGCTNTTFALAAAIPSGWSGGFDRASVTTMPGTNSVAALAMTPPSSATGTSGFTASATRSGSTGQGGSTSGSILIAAVAAPPAPAATALDVSVSAVSAHSGVQLSAAVSANGVKVSGASVSFRITDPRGTVTVVSATTTSSGIATSTFKPKPKDPNGTYHVQATATSAGITGTATTTFVN